jgi:hypothetical protein
MRLAPNRYEKKVEDTLRLDETYRIAAARTAGIVWLDHLQHVAKANLEEHKHAVLLCGESN